jgi:hypothetical protein
VRVALLAVVAIAGTASLTGCSGTAIDSSCDVEAITDEVEHMVGESHLSLTSLDSLACSGSWALARATVSGDGQSAQPSTFLFEKSDSGWFLRSPEIACGGDPGLPSVPEDLRGDACTAA